MKWARDVLIPRLPDPVTDGQGTDGVILPIRNDSPATVRKWRGVAPTDTRHTYKLAEQIAQELRDRPADWWNPRWAPRPVTEDEWLKSERIHILSRARRTAELCGNCGRDLEPSETVVRRGWANGTECLDCQGAYGSKRKPVVCEGCGRPTKDFRRGYRTLCCERCQSVYYRRRQRQDELERRADEGPRLCEQCQEVIDLDGRSDARYCSAACRQKAYRSRAKQA